MLKQYRPGPAMSPCSRPHVSCAHPSTLRPVAFRFCRVPEDCPAAIRDLVYQCLDREPSARPNASELVLLLSRDGPQVRKPSDQKPMHACSVEHQPLIPKSCACMHGWRSSIWKDVTRLAFWDFAAAAGGAAALPRGTTARRRTGEQPRFAQYGLSATCRCA